MSGRLVGRVLPPSPRHEPSAPARAFDLLAAIVAATIAVPLVCAGALALKLWDPGPVLCRRRRVGQGGREFELLTLRTSDASAVGRTLRRTRIDTLPQLWNLLRGDVSLVGPRPQLPEMVAELELAVPLYDRRDLTRPGITGWAHERRVLAAVRGG